MLIISSVGFVIFCIVKISFYNLKTCWDCVFVHSDINIQLSSTACWNASFLDQRYENCYFCTVWGHMYLLVCKSFNNFI